MMLLIQQSFFIIGITFHIAESFIYSSRYGKPCLNECETYKSWWRSSTETWCWTENGWDFCSKLDGITYNKKICRSKCTYSEWFWNNKGYWCYIRDEKNNQPGWDYCSIYDNKKFILSGAITSDGFFCETQREKRGKDYYWCHTANYWGYCSPARGISSKGNKCSICGGENPSVLYACETGWFSDYCGLFNDCGYGSSEQCNTSTEGTVGNSQHTEDYECRMTNSNYDLVIGSGNTKGIRQKAFLLGYDGVSSGEHFANELISRFDKSTMLETNIRNDELRLTCQNTFQKNDEAYADLHILFNHYQSPDSPADLLAHVETPIASDISTNVIRAALIRSVHEKRSYVIERKTETSLVVKPNKAKQQHKAEDVSIPFALTVHNDAQLKCPVACAARDRKWNGHWNKVSQHESVCGCI